MKDGSAFWGWFFSSHVVRLVRRAFAKFWIKIETERWFQHQHRHRQFIDVFHTFNTSVSTIHSSQQYKIICTHQYYKMLNVECCGKSLWICFQYVNIYVIYSCLASVLLFCCRASALSIQFSPSPSTQVDLNISKKENNNNSNSLYIMCFVLCIHKMYLNSTLHAPQSASKT